MSTLATQRLSYALGAKVSGIDLARPLSSADVAVIRAALYEHHVLLFQDQALTPAQHVAMTEHFGPQEPYVFEYQQHPGFPVINVVTNRRGDEVRAAAINRGTEWHSDLSFTTRPAEMSLLYCREAPEVGGNTIFANMVMAYERLSPAFQRIIDDAYAVHALFDKSYTAAPRATHDQQALMMRKLPPIAQRMVLQDPSTGRRALYVHESVNTEIVGMSAAESAAILSYLFSHAQRIEFTYRHPWRKGDLLIWDNRAVMHQEVPDSDGRQARLMHRTTTLGPARGAIVPEDRTGWDPARADPAAQPVANFSSSSALT